MSDFRAPTLTRRAFLASTAALSAGVVLPLQSKALAADIREFRLRAGPGRVQIAPEPPFLLKRLKME